MDQLASISHQGFVLRCDQEKAYVALEENVACQSCRAKGACGVDESNNELYEIPRRGLAVGDKVKIEIAPATAFKSVLFAYLLPFFIILAVIILGTIFNIEEGLTALTSLGAVTIYYLILFWSSQHNQSRFHLTIQRL